jgi:hypothetical protein
MSSYRFIHTAVCAAILVLLLSVVACSSNRVRGGEAGLPTQSDYGENAMTGAEDYLPPAANGHGPKKNGHGPKLDGYPAARPTNDGHGSPPPPPPPPPPPEPERCCGDDPSQSAGSAHRPPKLSAPATDTSAGEDDAVAEGPDAADAAPFAGLGAFIKPPVWTAERWYTLEFVAGQNQAALKDVSEDRELTTTRKIWMAPTMRVILDPNPNFEMKPQNPDQEIQELSPDKTAAWFWNVKPLKPGTFTLVARVQALVRGPDGELVKGPDGKLKGRVYPPSMVDVQVRVGTKTKALNAIGNASSFGDAFAALFKSWEKMLIALAALIAAVGGVWAAVRKLRGPTN